MSSAATPFPQSFASAPQTGGTEAPKLRVGQVSEGLRKWRKFKSALVSGICLICAVLVVTPLALVFSYLVIKGAGAINLDFFIKLPVPHGEVGGGVVHAIVGSVLLVGLAALIGLPTGILGAVYLTEYAGAKFASCVRFAADLLNGVPSIVWGIVAYAILVLPKGSPFSLGHYSAIAGALALAFIMIPLVLRTTEEVLLLVPNSYREAALALGIAKWKISTSIVLKTASKGILTGALLAIARVSGETAPLLFTALGNSGFSHSLKDPMAALPLQIYTYAISPYPDENRQAWAAALVLLLLVLTLNVGLRYLTRERGVGKPGKPKRALAAEAATAALTRGAATPSQA
jgi:phosphate transport system permease protein